MKILLAGDWHLHNFQQFSRPWREGLNTRVRDIYEVVGVKIPRLLKSRNVNVMCHLGDWHMNSTNDYRLVNLTKEIASACEREVFGRVVPIHGNHDTVSSDSDNHNALPYFYGKFVTQTIINKTLFICVGYNDLLQVGNGYEHFDRIIVLLHKDIQGGKTSKGFVYRSNKEIKIADLLKIKKKYHQVRFFAGHLHEHQVIKKLVTVVGAPVQHNRGDEGSKRGVVIYDSDKDMVEFVHLDGPEFLTLDFNTGMIREKIDNPLYLTIRTSGDSRKLASEWVADQPNDNIVAVIKDEKTEQVLSKPVIYNKGHDELELLDRWLKIYEPGLTAKQRSDLVKVSEKL